jgi:hypothetical protein
MNTEKDTFRKSIELLKKWNNEKRRIINSNLEYRWISTVSAIIITFILVYAFGLIAKIATDPVSQIVAFAYLAFLLYVPTSYWVKSSRQISNEYGLNYSLYEVRKEISKVNLQKKEDEDLRSLQVKMRTLRRNLLSFVQFSSVLTPVVYDYELDRLYKGIDVFFSTAGEVLLENESLTFSRMQEIERREQNLDYYVQGRPTEKEVNEHFEMVDREEEGIIETFDFQAMDECLCFLGERLFYRSKPYGIRSSQHPINLIRLSEFFNHWTGILSSCRNSKKTYNRLVNDINAYYKKIERQEAEHRQRMADLRINLLTIFVSVTLSAIVAVLLK